MPDFQKNTFEKLIEFHEKEHDLIKTVKVCKSMLKSPNVAPLISGEVAEVVLYVMLEDYIKRNNLKEWRLSKGLVLKSLEKGSNYSTELDITLFTPKCIFSFECKCYKGEKYIQDKGSLYVKRGKDYKFAIDVYDQHEKHFKALMNNIKVAQDPGVFDKKYRSYKLLYFEFVTTPTIDKRDKQSKAIFPLISYKNLYKVFKNYNDRPDYWNMDIINRMVDIIEKNTEKNKKTHIDYVKSLHPR